MTSRPEQDPTNITELKIIFQRQGNSQIKKLQLRQMGGGISYSDNLKNTIDDTVMNSIYDMANTCKSITEQQQSIDILSGGSITIDEINQEQSTKADLSCLADNKVSSMFTQDFKNNMQQDLKQNISGVGTTGMQINNLTDNVVNSLYTNSSIKSIQDAITQTTQQQRVNLKALSDVNVRKINQKQIADAVLSQISKVTSDAIQQSEKESTLKVSQTQEVKGADLTVISTTAIKTVGSVLTTFANAMIIGTIILIVAIIGVTVLIIVFIKKNCGTIKETLDKSYDMIKKTIRIPMLQLKMITMALGVLCPAPQETKENNTPKPPQQTVDITINNNRPIQ